MVVTKTGEAVIVASSASAASAVIEVRVGRGSGGAAHDRHQDESVGASESCI